MTRRFCGSTETGVPITPPTLADWWVKTDGQSLYDFLIGIKPTLIVNERVERDQGLGDFADPEQFVPPAPLSRQWETNATMNGAWGYNAGSENSYKPTKSMIQELVQVVSRDGNYQTEPRGHDGAAGRSVFRSGSSCVRTHLPGLQRLRHRPHRPSRTWLQPAGSVSDSAG
jgi:alpha-L-fucosidase